MSRSPRATARNSFPAHQEDSFIEPDGKDPLKETIWTSPLCTETRVDWQAFLESQHDLTRLQATYEIVWEASKFSSAGFLVEASAMLFRNMRQRDALPTLSETAAQLQLMCRALARFAALSQGLSANAEVMAQPDWLAFNPRRSVIFMPDQLIAALHPVLHTTIEAADAPRNTAEIPFNESQQQYNAYQARKDVLQKFFTTISEVLDRLGKAADFAAAAAQKMPRQRSKGAPGNPSRDWLLIRLMWIWRDALGNDLTIYLPKIKDRSARDDLTPDGCLGFIVSVLADIEPVKPNQLSVLERKLIELRRRVPDKPLVSSRLERTRT